MPQHVRGDRAELHERRADRLTGHLDGEDTGEVVQGRLKIDRSFLRDLHSDQGSVAVIAAVLTLAHNLRKSVVAEGVEDAASLAVLQDLGCSYAQGYHLARPQPPDELTGFLTERPAAVPT